MTAPLTGRFVWHELHTGDRAKALSFYKTLIGWETQDVQMGPGEAYGLCKLGGKDIAGIMKAMAPDIPPHWLPYIAADVDAHAKKAASLGAKIVVPAMDIPNVGRFAVVQDPQGGAFALFSYPEGRPAPEEHERPPVGSFCWEELISSDPAASAKFYSDLFGYTVEEMDMGPMGTYRMLKRGDAGAERQTAGIMKTPPGAPPQTHWLTYIHVKEVDASTRNAKELGAVVHMQPTDIPKIGRFSVIGDPSGAAVALFTGSM